MVINLPRSRGSYTCSSGSLEVVTKDFNNVKDGKKSYVPFVGFVDILHPKAELEAGTWYHMTSTSYTPFGYKKEFTEGVVRLDDQDWWMKFKTDTKWRARLVAEAEASEARKVAKKARSTADSSLKVVVERETKLAKISSPKDKKMYEPKVIEARNAAATAAEKATIAERYADEKEQIAKKMAEN